jgi:hypothetical protein
MGKDNVALISVLEHRGLRSGIVVCNAHLTWDPQFADVKVVQTVMLMHQLQQTIQSASQGFRVPAKSLPCLVCGDFNSLADSAVFELIHARSTSKAHADLSMFDYDAFFAANPLSHNIPLETAYHPDQLPFTNYTESFKGAIDYIWFTPDTLRPVAVLSPVDAVRFRLLPLFVCVSVGFSNLVRLLLGSRPFVSSDSGVAHNCLLILVVDVCSLIGLHIYCRRQFHTSVARIRPFRRITSCLVQSSRSSDDAGNPDSLDDSNI